MGLFPSRIYRDCKGASPAAAARRAPHWPSFAAGTALPLIAAAVLMLANIGSETAAVPEIDDFSAARLRANATHPPSSAEAPVRRDGPPTVSGSRPQQPVGLIQRISEGLVLPPASDTAVDRELDWYVGNADHLYRVLRRSERYLHHIVEALERNAMPLDLALLPIFESAYDPFAYSRKRAAGLWQIIPGTGRELGLRQDRWYDARRDVLQSTEAALRYLRRLEQQFEGDWLLAVAGYNAGGGAVSRALRRAAADGRTADFWGARPYLPAETRAYVPKLLALARLVADPEAFGVTLPTIADEPYFRVIETGGRVDMALAAQAAGMSIGELYLLNPGVNPWAVAPDGPHRLLVRVGSADDLAQATAADAEVLAGVRWVRHIVSAGETLGHLARQYQTTAEVLRQANGIAGDLIRVGQALMVPQPAGGAGGYGLLDAVRPAPHARLSASRR